MTNTLVAILVFAVIDTFVTLAIIASLARGGFGPFAEQFPAVEALPGAVRREFQSLKVGASNFGGCVHIAVDERFLHLYPARFLRMFGCEAASIPWERIAIVKPAGKAHAVARAGSITFTAPRWALELASPPP